jgi:hypothetical protein
LWTSAGDDLLLWSRATQNQLLLGPDTTLKAVSQTTIGDWSLLSRPDSGAVVRQRVGGVGYGEHADGGWRGTQDGVALLWAARDPGAIRVSSRGARGPAAARQPTSPPTSSPGFCAQPGTPCPPSSGTISARPTGGFGAAWTQVQPVDYDGLRVDVTGKRGVIGHFVPEP